LASRFAFLHETNSIYQDKGFAGHGRQPGLLSNEPPKSMRLNSFQLIKSCGTLTVSSWPKTHNPYLDLVPSRQFIVTHGFAATNQDWQKPRHPDPPAGGTPTNQTAGPSHCAKTLLFCL